MIHTIKKIAGHRHTKTVASLAIVASFFGYFLNYKPSLASGVTIYTDYVSDIHIESTNSNDFTVARVNDRIILTYKLNNIFDLAYQAVDIADKKAEIKCRQAKIKEEVRLNCVAWTTVTDEEISKFEGKQVPSKLHLSYASKGEENTVFDIAQTTDTSFVIFDEKVVSDESGDEDENPIN